MHPINLLFVKINIDRFWHFWLNEEVIVRVRCPRVLPGLLSAAFLAEKMLKKWKNSGEAVLD